MIYKVKLKNADSFVRLDDAIYEWLTNDPHYKDINLIDNLRLHSSGCAVFQKVWKKYDGSYKTETIYLHKIIAERHLSHLRTKDTPLVSVKNGDKLDCRLDNITWRARSMTSRLRKTTNSTGYTGVYLEHRRYRAVISIDGQVKHLGMFPTPEEAAVAYNRASKDAFGNEGKLNKIRSAS